jgi:hypothetical protein
MIDSTRLKFNSSNKYVKSFPQMMVYSENKVNLSTMNAVSNYVLKIVVTNKGDNPVFFNDNS